MEEPITFPVSLEAFTAYQAAGIGRDLTDSETEIIALSVPLINKAYRDGLNGGTWLKDILAVIDCSIGESDGATAQYFKSLRCWLVCAWNQGRGGAAE